MSPFQIWVRDDFREDFQVYLIESLAEDGDGRHDLDVLGGTALLEHHALAGGLHGEAGVERGAHLAGGGGADQRVLGARGAVNLESLFLPWSTWNKI